MKISRQQIGSLLFQLGILASIATWVPDFCFKQTDGFSLCRLQSAFPPNPEWEIASLAPEEQEKIEHALDQHYRYLGFGGQCYAFESEDRRYVLKFFKHRLRKPQAWLIGLPWPEPLRSKADKFYARLYSKHERDYRSYKLAYEQLKQETGLLYIHLNKTAEFLKQLVVADKLGIVHQIDLNQTEFILQEKAQLVYPSIAAMIERGDLEQIRRSFRSIFDLILSRCRKGIYDEDPRIHCNVGLQETEAMFIDVGRFHLDPRRADREVYLSDLKAITGRFKEWISNNYPDLTPLFEQEMARCCESS
jgi:hypothetical protein